MGCHAAPAPDRLPAFIVVFVAIILCSFISSLIAQNGAEFITSTPVIGFGVFSLIGVAVLFTLPRSKFGGVVIGIFYLIPILYAALVLTLAILDRQTSGGLLTVVSPPANGVVLGSVNMKWEPAQPAFVTISNGEGAVETSKGFVLPPYRVTLEPGSDYTAQIQGRLGTAAKVTFHVDRDPRRVPLSSVYRPPAAELVGKSFLDGSLEIPTGFSIVASVNISTYGKVELFGVADQKYAARCGLMRPRGEDMCSYLFLHIPIPDDEGTTVKLKGYVLDRLGQKHHFQQEVTAVFREILVTIDIDVEHDGTVELLAVPG
jgi:hypothetical protein